MSYWPLHDAVVSGNPKTVKRLLARRGRVNGKRPCDGNAPLHLAVMQKNEEIVELLLKARANVHSCNRERLRPLELAIKNDCNLNILTMLIDAGDDVNTTDNFEITALHLASKNLDVSSIEFLVKLGALPNSRDKSGRTPLNYVIASEVNDKNLRLQSAEKLLSLGADVNTSKINISYSFRYSASFIGSELQFTPLLTAVLRGNLDDVKLLVDHGANVDNVTLFSAYKMHENHEIFEFLLNNSADFHNSDFLVNLLSECGRIRGETYLERMMACYFKMLSDMDGFAPRKNLSCESCKIILQHIAKLQALNVTINQKLIDTISNKDDHKNYFEQCAKELLKAKNIKFSKCWVTFFNIFKDGERKILKYAGNKILVKHFRRTVFKKKFPIYGSKMKSNMSKGIRDRKIWDLAARKLSYNLKRFDPTHPIIRDALNCLDIQDLYNFVNKK